MKSLLFWQGDIFYRESITQLERAQKEIIERGTYVYIGIYFEN
jgi:hypothetical protein